MESSQSNIDLSNLNISELQELIKRADTEIKNRKVSEQKQAIEQIQKIAAAAGLSMKELAGKPGIARKATSAPTVTYQHPEDASKVWHGRGRIPGWVNEQLQAGKTREDLRVK